MAFHGLVSLLPFRNIKTKERLIYRVSKNSEIGSFVPDYSTFERWNREIRGLVSEHATLFYWNVLYINEGNGIIDLIKALVSLKLDFSCICWRKMCKIKFLVSEIAIHRSCFLCMHGWRIEADIHTWKRLFSPAFWLELVCFLSKSKTYTKHGKTHIHSPLHHHKRN